MADPINLALLPRETLLIVAERACNRLCGFANMLTFDEGSAEDTEEEFGIEASEVIEMAHDNMILESRAVLDSIQAEIAAARERSEHLAHPGKLRDEPLPPATDEGVGG